MNKEGEEMSVNQETKAMDVETALARADDWTIRQTFYPGQEGWRVVCAVLAAEVRRLRQRQKSEAA
jgi:hypothetical protein